MRRLIGPGLLGALLALAGAGQAQAATTIGNDLVATPNTPLNCSGQPCTFVQRALPGRQLTSPIDGVIVRWRIKIAAGSVAQPVNLRVVRGTGAASTGAGMSSAASLPATAGIHTFETRLPIKSGDFVGIDGGSSNLNAFSGAGGASMDSWGPRLGEGETRAGAASPSFQLLMNADVEPDADNDGFGDETQDQCPTNPSTQGPCPDTTAPETTIKSGPIKTDQPKARFVFESSEAGATFQCKIKGKHAKRALKVYAPCTSPTKYRRLAPGKYRFFVFATDATGNLDATPAKQKFRIVEEL